MVETMSGSLAVHCFTMEDQAQFAALSHDSNPMHVDPLAARRTQYGFPVVHGVHALLWALDALFRQRPEITAAGLQVRFVKPMLVGDTVSAAITAEKPGDIALAGSVAGTTVMTIRLTAAEPRNAPREAPVPPLQLTPLLSAAHDLPIEALPGRQGVFRYEGTAIAAAFPAVAAALGADVVTGLAAATYVVGMECPGLHSIFSGITAALRGEGEPGVVRFEATKVDPRFRVVDMALRTAGFTATLGSFARMPPVQQADLADLASRIAPKEFAGQRSLVIGGSRGIGEVTAKLLAAGGARVAVTYAAGSADAQKVVADINAAGGDAQVFRYDVRESAELQLNNIKFAPNTIYYCATGPVFRRKTAMYEPDIMSEFIKFYVDGFYGLCNSLRNLSDEPLVAFYPSTVAVENPVKDLMEYSAAKLAGEMLCSHLSSFIKNLQIVVSRLPRTNTDLTATTAMAEAADPADVMLPILRQMQAALMKEA